MYAAELPNIGYDIPNKYMNCPRIFLIWLASVNQFNLFYPEFNIKFVNGEEKITLAKLIKQYSSLNDDGYDKPHWVPVLQALGPFRRGNKNTRHPSLIATDYICIILPPPWNTIMPAVGT